MCIDFIWRYKRHEVNKKLCLKPEQGDLNMMDLMEFNVNLKIPWIRKILNSNADLLEIANYHKIDRLLTTDIKYQELMIQQIENPSWKSVAISYEEWLTIQILFRHRDSLGTDTGVIQE